MHPTHRKLAAWCKCSVGTVKRHLSWLEGGRVVMEQRFRLRDGSPVMPRCAVDDIGAFVGVGVGDHVLFPFREVSYG